MAEYVPLEDNDPNKSVLQSLTEHVRKYVVTWSNAVDGIRKIFGIYRTQRQAFLACREAANRSRLAFPLCFLKTANLLEYYKVLANNIFTH